MAKQNPGFEGISTWAKLSRRVDRTPGFQRVVDMTTGDAVVDGASIHELPIVATNYRALRFRLHHMMDE